MSSMFKMSAHLSNTLNNLLERFCETRHSEQLLCSATYKQLKKKPFMILCSVCVIPMSVLSYCIVSGAVSDDARFSEVYPVLPFSPLIIITTSLILLVACAILFFLPYATAKKIRNSDWWDTSYGTDLYDEDEEDELEEEPLKEVLDRYLVKAVSQVVEPSDDDIQMDAVNVLSALSFGRFVPRYDEIGEDVSKAQKKLDEAKYICSIWSSSYALEGTKLSYSSFMKRSNKIHSLGRKLGCDHMVELLYAGVPIRDILA